jgi:YfiH family protein
MLHCVRIDALAALPDIGHGFFTRRGGVSGGIYASLNCGVGSKDDPEAVRENRARVVGHLGARRVVTAYQVHGTAAMVVDDVSATGERPKADAMVTATRGLALGVLTADCAPILLADPGAGVIGAAHAGWRGALSGIGEAAIEAMEGLGASRQRVRAAVGPCIGASVYEVGPEFEAAFAERDPASAPFFTRPEGDRGSERRPTFDLAGYVAARLRRAGVGRVETADTCSYSVHNDFFSYRRSLKAGATDYGRQISAIVLT